VQKTTPALWHWPLTIWPKICGFSGLTVDHFCVKFGDSCSGFFRYRADKQTNRQTNKQTNAGEATVRTLSVVERSSEVDVVREIAIRFTDRRPVDQHTTWRTPVHSQSNRSYGHVFLRTRQYTRTGRTTDRRTRLQPKLVCTPRLESGHSEVASGWRVVDDDAVVIKSVQSYDSCNTQPWVKKN